MTVQRWERAWEDLATMFDYLPDIRQLIYTSNAVEGYNRQLRKVTKTKGHSRRWRRCRNCCTLSTAI
ncbi:transposase [Herpetosiphon geysericola]|uniref:transposase n=1 Tax=Herpetosiphon geysericola TaxID=70996 RepID=UPI00191C6CDA